MTNALAIYKDFDGLQRAALALYKSGYFEDAKSEAQAIVKVMAGAEVGIPPFASMAGINIIQGKPAFGANLIATLVENDPRYEYKILRADDEVCTIEWYKNGERQGVSSFTMEEARKVKQWNSKKNAFEPLANKFNWQNWPSDMLFARALTRGQKRYAAGIAGGAPLYTPEELGAEVDEDGNVIDGTYSVPEQVEQPEPEPDQVEDAIKDAGPEAVDEPMTIERAAKITDSKGTPYIEIDSETLSKKTIGISKGLSKPDLTDEKRQFYQEKLDAIKVILQARESGEI